MPRRPIRASLDTPSGASCVVSREDETTKRSEHRRALNHHAQRWWRSHLSGTPPGGVPPSTPYNSGPPPRGGPGFSENHGFPVPTGEGPKSDQKSTKNCIESHDFGAFLETPKSDQNFDFFQFFSIFLRFSGFLTDPQSHGILYNFWSIFGHFLVPPRWGPGNDHF